MRDLYGPMDPALLHRPHPADPCLILSTHPTGGPPLPPPPPPPNHFHYTGWTPWGTTLSPPDYYYSSGILDAPAPSTTAGATLAIPPSHLPPL